MSSLATVLVAGANRGIAKGFVQPFLSRTSTTVIACIRTSSLAELPKADGSQLITNGHGIKTLDIVIANAGSVENSVAGMVKAIDTASKDTSGSFQTSQGSVNPW